MSQTKVSPLDPPEVFLGEVDVAKQWEDSIDLSIYDLEDHVKDDFAELFSEPDSFRKNILGEKIGGIVIGEFFRYIFIYTRAAVYYGLAIVIGFFMSMIWAVFMAFNQLMIVWFVHPMMKIMYSWLRLMAMPLRAVTRMVCDPVFQSIGQMFSFVRGRFRLDVPALKIVSDLPALGSSKIEHL